LQRGTKGIGERRGKRKKRSRKEEETRMQEMERRRVGERRRLGVYECPRDGTRMEGSLSQRRVPRAIGGVGQQKK